MSAGHIVPTRRKPGRRALLDGNFARRTLPLRETEYCIWDTELAGFGLRVRPTGKYYWFVRLRHRGKHRRITLGRSDELAADLARTQARRLLAEVALDGLPKRAVVKATPIMSDFVDTYWDDLSRVWKASTSKRNWNAWKTVIAPTFGTMRVADILPADIHRWRDDWPMFNESFELVVGSGHALAMLNSVDLDVELIRGEQFLLLSGADLTDYERERLGTVGINLINAHEVDSSHDMETMVAAGFGIAVAPKRP